MGEMPGKFRSPMFGGSVQKIVARPPVSAAAGMNPHRAEWWGLNDNEFTHRVHNRHLNPTRPAA